MMTKITPKYFENIRKTYDSTHPYEIYDELNLIINFRYGSYKNFVDLLIESNWADSTVVIECNKIVKGWCVSLPFHPRVGYAKTVVLFFNIEYAFLDIYGCEIIKNYLCILREKFLINNVVIFTTKNSESKYYKWLDDNYKKNKVGEIYLDSDLSIFCYLLDTREI